MNAHEILVNLIVYSLQVGVFLALTVPLPRLLGLRRPHVRFSYYRALLVGILLLPFLELLLPRETTEPTLVRTGIETVVSVSAPNTAVLSIPTAILIALGFTWCIRSMGMLLGLLVLHHYRRISLPLAVTPQSLDGLRFRLGCHAPVRASDRLNVPISFGWRNPVVLVPLHFSSLPAEKQRGVLCHELLHLTRGDWPLALLEEVIRSIFWFHPAVLILLDRIQLSREQVVDQEVVRITGDPQAYLETLGEYARIVRATPLSPAIPFIRASHLKHRLALLTQEVSMSRSHQRVLCSLLFISMAILSIVTVYSLPTLGPLQTAAISSHLTALSGAVPSPAVQEAAQEQQQEERDGAFQIEGDADIETKLVKKVNPVYPEEARSQRITGLVRCKVKVDEAGKVVRAEVEESPHELLSQACLDALRQWEYEPPRLEGKPVSFFATIHCNFVLN